MTIVIDPHFIKMAALVWLASGLLCIAYMWVRCSSVYVADIIVALVFGTVALVSVIARIIVNLIPDSWGYGWSSTDVKGWVMWQLRTRKRDTK